MSKLSIISKRDVIPSTTYQGPRTVSGVISSHRLTPEGYALWMCESDLADGAEIFWDEEHGEDIIYVIEGEVEIENRVCPTDGAVVVEGGVKTILKSIGRSRVVHFGSRSNDEPSGIFGSPERLGRGVHVVGPGGTIQSGEAEGVHAVWYADSTCRTCRCQLLQVTAPPRENDKGKPHSHSEDEIIYLLEGRISMGAYELEKGSALCVPGNVRYSLVGGAEGHRFINFRRDVSEQIYERNSEPLLETGLARGGRLINDLR